MFSVETAQSTTQLLAHGPFALAVADQERGFASFADWDAFGEVAKTEWTAWASATNWFRSKGAATAADWWVRFGGVSAADARAHQRAGDTLGWLPEVHAALRAGTLSVAATRAIQRVASKSRRLLRAASVDQAQLIGQLSGKTATEAARVLGVWERAQEDPDRPESERQRQRRNVAHWTDDHGMGHVLATLSPEDYAAFIAELDRRVDQMWRGLHPERDVPSDPEDRRLGRLRADMFMDMVHLHSNTETKRTGRRRAALHVFSDFESLLDRYLRTTFVETIDGTPLSAATLRRLACDADIIPTVFGGASQILDHGLGRRTVSDAQFEALIVRDGGCVVCGANVMRCQAHHLVWWSDGGGTDISNLVLVCADHHHLVHEGGHDLRPDKHGHWELYRPEPKMIGRHFRYPEERQHERLHERLHERPTPVDTPPAHI